MHRLSFVAAALLMAASTLCTSIAAQSSGSGRLQFGLMGGLTAPAGDLSSSSLHSANVGALLIIGAQDSRLRFRLDGQWQQLTGKTSEVALACPGCTSESFRRDHRVLDATANAVFGSALSHSLGAYLIGGIGVYRVRGTTAVQQGDAIFTEMSSATRFGFNGGVGVTLRMRHVATFVEARYHQLLGAHTYESDGVNGELPGAFQFVPISVGIVF